MLTVHQRYRRTDKQPDGRTTYDSNTGALHYVHRAVKTDGQNTAQSDFVLSTVYVTMTTSS